jgi:uncharacterized membrane protein
VTGPKSESAADARQNSRDEEVQQLVGRLLQTGVLLSAFVVAVGGAMLLARYGGATADFRNFAGEPASLTSVAGILHSVLGGDRRALVQLGLVLLIATPVARVALTLGAFIFQRDRLYVAITTVVLALLLYGLLWGRT